MFAYRQVYLPMSYVYGVRGTCRATPLTAAIRNELYPLPYSSINWNQARWAGSAGAAAAASVAIGSGGAAQRMASNDCGPCLHMLLYSHVGEEACVRACGGLGLRMFS
jgi:hypothetical protein